MPLDHVCKVFLIWDSSKVASFTYWATSQQIFTCSKSTIEALEKKFYASSKLTIKTPERRR